MDIREFMKTHGLTDAELDNMAEPYENGDFPSSRAPVQQGSHVTAQETKQITVLYSRNDVERASALAREKGVHPADIYRAALSAYLAQAKA